MFAKTGPGRPNWAKNCLNWSSWTAKISSLGDQLQQTVSQNLSGLNNFSKLFFAKIGPPDIYAFISAGDRFGEEYLPNWSPRTNLGWEINFNLYKIFM